MAPIDVLEVCPWSTRGVEDDLYILLSEQNHNAGAGCVNQSTDSRTV